MFYINSVNIKAPGITMNFKQIAITLIAMVLSLTCTAEPIKLNNFTHIGGDFELSDVDDRVVALSDFRGKVVLLYFGYITCPDVCPTTLIDLAAVYDKLDTKKDQVKILFITVDPERDTPENVKSYLEYFNTEFIGLRGSVKEISKIAGMYGSSFWKRKLGSAAGYLIDHSAFVYMIDRQGKIRYLFPFESEPQKMIEGIQLLLK